ncbi:hypothetical protein PAESOLCIP111_06294 [Paenibacillus solanacearum]|uniref:SLH domain-containing protein n=1 Tax=Paenibacillus solanacearum TaxID=2048548 RepID=A0A916KA44_9BACL|nr:S-layer homology domain-containing protein [Paenibacillus solanacearum]CAG7651327.1 hypothetical protein PAESOLCIP111_06294 [Paenibacillus solanacearum]
MEVLFRRNRLVLLFAVLICTILAMLLGGENKVYAAFSGGEGSSENPYIITNVAQLNEVRNGMDAHYRLDVNLNLDGVPSWAPIGDWSSNPFTGVFDGNGHTISNLTIDTGGAGTSNRGLFGYISNAEIRNVGLVNVKINAGTGDNIGGLVAFSESSTIEYVYVTGTVAGDESVGGVAGYTSGNPSDAIRSSYSAVKATGTVNVGGLIGKKEGFGTIISSYYNSDLTSGSAGGAPLTEANMKSSSYFTGWDFTDNDGDESEWGILEGMTYPMHRKTFDRITLDTLEVTVGSGPNTGDPVELEPVFSSDRLTYLGHLPNAVDKVTLSVNAQGSVASIDGGGGTATETIDLIEGANTILIKVSSAGTAVPAPCAGPCTLPDPYVLEYTLQLSREDGSTYPHSISTAEQLAAIGTGVTDGYQLGDHYILMNDIDLSGYLSPSGWGYNGAKGWEPIGDAAHPFTGTFDGNGHVIRNLFIDRENEDDIGFFGVASGTIKSISLTNMDITGKRTVGGLVGSLLDGGAMMHAYTAGTVTATAQRAGGLAGKLEGDVAETYSTANVIGLNGSDSIGGLIGETENASVTDSYAAGTVTSTASSRVGGFIGASINTVVTDSFWDIETSHHNTSAGGSGAAGKQTAEMKSTSTFSNADVDWDFTNTWAMMAGTTYPMFKHDYEAVKLASLSVMSTGAVLSRDPASYKPEQGLYTITSNRYIQTVDIAVGLANLHSTAAISGTEATSATVPVVPGDNEIAIETKDKNGMTRGSYKLKIQVPAPQINDVELPSDGYYGIGDTLTFTVSYEGNVDAPVGTPRLPIVIGEGADPATVYATYTEQPAGEQNKLIFTYEVQEGFTDADGIEIGTAIDLPVGAGITASGVVVPLAVPAAGTNRIVIDSKYPSIILTQSPDSGTLTKGAVTVTAATYGTGSDIVVTKWAEGARTKEFFASAGTLLTGGSFQVTTNGAYTVYTEDQAGNGAVEMIDIDNIMTELPQINLSYSPAVLTNGSVTVRVTADVYGDANVLTKLNWLPGSHPAADFAGGANGTDIMAVKQFAVTVNGTYTVYAKDTAGNEAVKEISIGNILTTAPELALSHNPITTIKGSVTISVVTAVYGEAAGNALAKLSWMPGSHRAAAFDGGGRGADILSAKAFTVDSNGVYTVYAKDAAGNETVEEISIVNILTTAPKLALSYNPTTTIKGSVTISVATAVYGEAAGNALAKLNWMLGSHRAAAFDGGGRGTDLLSAKAFTVNTNGTYTVYAKDTAGNETVEEISITNILTTEPELRLSFSPSTVTKGSVTISVTAAVYGEAAGNALAKLNWMPGSHRAAEFDGGGRGADILSAKAFTVNANGTYTIYAKDAAGNEAVEEISISTIVVTPPVLELSYSPTTSTAGPVVVHVSTFIAGQESGNTLAVLNWLSGSHVETDFAGGANGTSILAANAFTVAINGAYTVYAKDAAGNEAVKEISISNMAEPSPEPDEGGDDSDYGASLTPSSQSSIIKDLLGGLSIRIDASDIVKETRPDGTVVEKAVLSNKTIEQVLEALKEAQKPFVTIEINDSEQAVQVQFPAASLGKVADSYSDAAFVVELNDASFQLQIHVLDLEELAKQLGVDIRDMQVNVVIGKVSGLAKEQLEQIADNHGLKLIGQAVDYKVTVSAGDRTMEVRDFGGTYMVRAIVLDEDLSDKRIAAVLYDPETRTLSFVPAVTAARRDGQKEISMKVPHNSIYAIVEAEKKTFADLNGHWAKNDVELLASKLIVNGVSEARFAPDDSITRAEFTALMVRALGIKMEGKIESTRFQDVSIDNWYAPAIEAGVKAGLVDGISNDRFAPDSMITREQMAVMIANALSIAGKPGMDDNQAVKYLVNFDDRSDISIWARSAVAQSVAAGILQGLTEGMMAPAENATRAQATVMLKRFLQHVEFMD